MIDLDQRQFTRLESRSKLPIKNANMQVKNLRVQYASLNVNTKPGPVSKSIFGFKRGFIMSIIINVLLFNILNSPNISLRSLNLGLDGVLIEDHILIMGKQWMDQFERK